MDESFGLISIIMAAYNAEKTIEYAIDSVAAQTYSDWELLVVNDCSKDNTRAIVEAYAAKDSRIKLINNEKNSGVSITRLNALNAAKGDWIAILDSDDAWMPQKLEKQIALQKEKNADVVFTGVTYINEFGENLNWVFNVPYQVGYKKLLKQNVITNSSAIVRKELFAKHYAIGDYMHEDFALWLGVLKTGVTAYGINEPLIVYRVSTSSKSGNKFKSAIMNWKTYRFMNMNVLSSAYYMGWYTVNGILKYKNLK